LHKAASCWQAYENFFIILLLSFYCFIIFCCKGKQKNIYDEANYDLIKVDTLNGIVGTKFYRYRYDSSRKMQIDYWADGKLMAKTFSHYGKLDGKCIMYDTNGVTIMALDSFKDGVKSKSNSYYQEDTTMKIFRDGKLQPAIDSILK
jgi:antitoxin component YwqK of YwqJK toxin-antitoxin module